jgi:hypothetical protein
MKSRDFAHILKQVAELSRETQPRQEMNELADIFDLAGNATVAATLKRAKPAVEADEALSTAPLLPSIRQVQSLLAVAGKPAVVKDFKELVRVLQQHPALAFAEPKAAGRSSATPKARSSSAAALRTDLVHRYDSGLSAALGNETGFAVLYSRLQADSEMGPAELRELARRFAGAAGKSKAEALKKIWSRHQNVMMIQAKDRSTAGRSAA